MISIIIPNYNCATRLQLVLEQLHKQTDAVEVEIIVVDNESTDESHSVIAAFRDVILIENSLKNPYISRNIGIRHAKNEIIALLDAKCVPNQDWVATIRKYFTDKPNLLLGGMITQSGEAKDSFQLFYKTMLLDNERNLKSGLGFVVGNLVFHKNLINQIGYFNEETLSYEDINWTQKAISSGVEVKFASDLIVDYPTKEKSEILSANERDAKGMVDLYATNKKQLFIILAQGIIPPNPITIVEILKSSNLFSIGVLAKIWSITYFLRWRFLIIASIHFIKKKFF